MKFTSLTIVFVFLLSFVLLSFVLLSSVFAAGDLDTSFNFTGKYVRPVSLYISSPGHQAANLILPDGKILFAGNCEIPVTGGTTDGYLLYRINQNGTLDTSFGTNGTIQTNIGNFEAVGTLLRQPDGKILLSGQRYAGEASNDFSVLRYNTDGTLDNSFDGNGLAVANIGGFSSESGGFAVLQQDGKIVVAGQTDRGTNGADADWAVVRFNTNGSLDTSFDGDGKVIISLPGNSDWISAIALQPDGKILLAGHSGNSGSRHFALARLNPNGSLDPSFGTEGIVLTSIGASYDSISSVAIQTDGKIIVSGGTYNGTDWDLALARYSSNGSLDTGFGTNGLVIEATSFYEFGYSLALQPDGKPVISSRIASSAAVFRYTVSGNRDPSFGNNGKVATQVTSSTSANPYSLSIQPDGKIVISGVAYSNDSFGENYYFTIRYLNSSKKAAAFDFDGDDKTDIGIFRPGSSAEWWISRSSNNGVLAAQFGGAGDQPVPADYTGDGKTDIAFFRPSSGTWFVLRSEDNSFYGFPFGRSADVPAPADYDGDGKSDPAVFRNGAWYILRSSDNGVASSSFGVAGDKPVPADYDGDGKADIGIFRPNGGSGGEWWILRSTAGLLAASFGSAEDRTVVGDYTGDGKADCAFFRPSNGTWYVLRSEDLSFYGFPFGNSTDMPAPGDYDGDGKTDAAVFRPAGAAWFVSRSTGGVTSLTFGADGDSPVAGAYVR